MSPHGETVRGGGTAGERANRQARDPASAAHHANAKPAPAWRYRGWWTLGAGFSTSLIVIGSTMYSFQLYVKPIEETFELTRAQTNVGLILLNVGIALWSPTVGRLLDRASATAIIATGGVMLGIGLVTIALTSSLVVASLAVVGPLGLAVVCAGGLSATTVVAHWFERRRGLAMGLVASSSAAGGFVMTQVGAFLIATYGWRDALVITGIGGSVAIVGLALAFVTNRPAEGEIEAAGEHLETRPEIAAPREPTTWTTRRLLVTPNFWLIAFGAGLVLASDAALLASLVPYMQDLGLELQAAAFLIACQSASATLGKVAIGFCADRFDLRRLFLVVAGAHILLLIVLSSDPDYWILLSVFCVAGVAVGGTNPILTTLIAAAFGTQSYGAVHGRVSMIIVTLSMATILAIGNIYDRTGSYHTAFWIFGILICLACLFVSSIRLESASSADQTD